MSYISIHAHIVFATKNRNPFIHESWRKRLHEYLGGTANGLGALSQGIGGVEDHVHLLVGFKATHRLSDFIRELKKSASTWVRNEIGLQEFAWQEGYSAFSVSPTARSAVQRYIQNQEVHHRDRTLREELTELLEKAGIDFNPEYLEKEVHPGKSPVASLPGCTIIARCQPVVSRPAESRLAQPPASCCNSFGVIKQVMIGIRHCKFSDTPGRKPASPTGVWSNQPVVEPVCRRQTATPPESDRNPLVDKRSN